MLVVTLNGTPQPLFDGVMTNVEVQAGSGGSPGTVTVTGEDLTQGDGHAGLERPAVPGDADRGARRADLRQVRGVRHHPAADPGAVPRRADPDRPASRRSRAPTSRTSSSSPTRWATCSTSSPDPAPGTNIAYFGPGDQDRRAAAGAQRRHGRAHQRRVAELQLRSDQGRAAGRLHPEPADAGADPDPDPEPQSAAAAARRAADAAREHHGAEGHREAQPDAGDLARPRRGASARRTR